MHRYLMLTAVFVMMMCGCDDDGGTQNDYPPCDSYIGYCDTNSPAESVSVHVAMAPLEYYWIDEVSSADTISEGPVTWPAAGVVEFHEAAEYGGGLLTGTYSTDATSMSLSLSGASALGSSSTLDGTLDYFPDFPVRPPD